MLAVEVQRFVHVSDAAPRAAKRLDQEGVVGPAGARRLHEADALPLKEAAAINACPDGGVVEQQLNAVADCERLRRRLHAVNVGAGGPRLGRALAKEAPIRAAHDVDFLAGFGRDGFRAGDHLLERRGVEVVVRLHDGDPSPLGRRDAAVHGGAVALVGLVHDDDARVAGGVGARDFGRVVRGTVVHANNLQVAEGLRLDALEALVERGGHVVHGDDDRDDGFCAGAHVPSSGSGAVVRASL